MSASLDDPRRSIPSIDRLLGSDAFAPLLRAAPRARIVAALQRVQDEVRAQLATPSEAAAHDDAWYAGAVETLLAHAAQRSLRPVINATGVVLHTNLGRAPLAAEAIDAMAAVAGGYANLEYDVGQGRRGSRYDHCAALLCELTGAEAALVVNNNAAALVLALGTLAAGRAVVVSRGELVEIGGTFRVPEIIARSGARLHEVGATNRTRLADYQRALGPAAAAVLKVHRSNFRMSGFVEEVALPELARLTRAAGVPLVYDLGSGLLLEPARLGLRVDEPTPADALTAGADVVVISGDKLLGGPQAGILLGRAPLIAAMREDPLCRALRVDKLTLAALEATLALYRDPERALQRIPTLRMLGETAPVLRARADALVERLAASGVRAEVVPSDGAVGGGALPDVRLPGWAVALEAPEGAARLDAHLRAATPPVVAVVRDGRVLLDLRTVAPGQDEQLAALVANLPA